MTTTRRRRPRTTLRVESLEARQLMAAGLLASWIGQDGADYAGGVLPNVGNAVQDVRVQLTGLPSKDVSSVELNGHGGGRWVVNIGGFNPFNGKLVREPGASTADLYVEPYQVETGRQFQIKVTYADGVVEERYFNGGTADPNLRTPSWAATAAWVGQESADFVGNGAGVGPDGVVDARYSLSQLYPPTAITAVKVTRAGATGWASGTNPEGLNNAEFVRDANDPTRGSVFINPDVNLSGQPLEVLIYYADGKTDRTVLTAGPTNPALAVAPVAPVSLAWGVISASWVGQDGLNLTGLGDVRLSLAGVPAGRSVVSALLSNAHGTAWSYVKPSSGATNVDPLARPLGFKTSNDPTRADVTFAPVRNEVGSTLTLRVTLDDGSNLGTRFAGGTSDPGLRFAGPAATSVVAFPGDDLNDLAARFGTVRLVGGVYPMSLPLVLGKPVNLIAAPGTTLLFSQPVEALAWTAAIKVHSSHTTIDGLSVRFAGPVRWKSGISYGPAVIGTTDNFDAWTGDPKLNLVFTRLDLQGPPASSAWEEAPSLFRLVSAESGRIADNRLKGGMTELKGGPWLVTGNAYLGTLPNTYAYTAFAAHESREVTVSNNAAEPTGPSGKTWRFLVMTQRGIGDAVLNNTVRGIGPMDDDMVAHPNSPEVILTESYRLHYEGTLARVSADGQVVQVPRLMEGTVRTGSVLAILSGPQAGQWRLIAQAISPTAYVLDAPIDPGNGNVAVSVATGFVNQTFVGNSIDVRGSSVADPIVLAGNQFGATVVGNMTFGGDQSFRITAYPTEAPSEWGWSRAPFLGATIAGNTFEDSLNGGSLGVESNRYSKAVAGRVYFSGTFSGNTAVWTDAFLAAKGGVATFRLATVGTSFSVDAGEARLIALNNRVSGTTSVTSATTLQIISATVNSAAIRNQGMVLPATSTPLVNAGFGASGPTSAGRTVESANATSQPSAAATPAIAPQVPPVALIKETKPAVPESSPVSTPASAGRWFFNHRTPARFHLLAISWRGVAIARPFARRWWSARR